VRGKREEQVVPARRAWFGVCGEWELAKFLHVKSTRAAHTQLGEKLKFVKWTFSNIEKKSKHVARLLQPPPMERECSFLISSVRSARKKKIKISKIVLAQHLPTHSRGSTCSAQDSWASGSVPIGVATTQPFSLFLCVSFSHYLSLTLSFASLLAPASRRSFTAAVWPLAEAKMRAVEPYYI